MKKICFMFLLFFLVSSVLAGTIFTPKHNNLDENVYTRDDSGNVYFNEKIIEGSDLNTFEILYLKTSNTFFESTDIKDGIEYRTETRDNKIGYAKDKNNVYFNEKTLYGVDIDSFQVMNVTKIGLINKYFVDEKLDYTFVERSYSYARDKNFLYFNEVKISDVDFNSLNFGQNILYFNDNDNFYYNGTIFKTGGLSDFKYFDDSNYFSDGNNIYFKGSLTEIDSNSFSFIYTDYIKTDKRYAKDKNFVYFEGKKISNSSSNTFEFLPLNGPGSFSIVKFNDSIHCKNDGRFLDEISNKDSFEVVMTWNWHTYVKNGIWIYENCEEKYFFLFYEKKYKILAIFGALILFLYLFQKILITFFPRIFH